MSLRAFKTALQSTERYSPLDDRIELKEKTVVILLVLGRIQYECPLVSILKTKKFVFGDNDEYELNVFALKVKKNIRQDHLLEDVSPADWVRIYKDPVTDLDDWLYNFKRFIKSVIAARKSYEWRVTDDYPEAVFTAAKKLKNYSVVVISGEEGIGKTTLARRLLLSWTNERNLARTLDGLCGDGILDDVDRVDVDKLNKFKYRVIITTTSDNVFDGLDCKLNKKIKYIRLKKIPYLIYSVANRNELDQ